jgi:hypothetical protein
MFAYKKALVTITVENFDRENDYLKAVLSTLAFVKLEPPAKPLRVKLIDAAEHIHRYVTLELPKGFVPPRDVSQELAAAFAHHSAKPEIARPQITLQRVERPRQRGMKKFENVVKWRHSEFLDMYEDTKPLTKLKVSGRDAYRSRYTEKDDSGEWLVFDLVFQVREQIWALTMDAAVKDPKEVAAAEKAFAKMVRSIASWSGK